MAITSGASPGVVVTTAAVNETIPAQTNVSDANTQVEVSDDITTLSNGNLMASPVYTDRLIILRQGLSNEETRYISGANASGVGNTWILDVSEPWVSNPVGSTDTIHVSYIIQDAATLTGLGLVNKTVQDYNSTRRFTVGSGGGTFAFMAFINGVGLQMDDNGSTTVASFTIENGGRFDCGYLANGIPTGGCYMQGANGTDGELAFEMISGGEWNCYATYITGVNRELIDFNTSTTSKIRMFGVRWSFAINDILWGVQDTELNDVAFLSDGGGTTPRIDVRDWATGNQFKNVVANGFDGFESNTSGDDPEIRNIQFIGMSKFFTIATAENWVVVNPVGLVVNTANQNDISIAGTGDLIVKYEFRNFSHSLDDTALTAKHYVIARNYRGVIDTPTLMNEDTADANGLSVQDIETDRFIDGGASNLSKGTTSGFAQFSAEYGYLPIVKNIAVANEDETSFPTLYGKSVDYAHSDDVYQVETNAGTARTLGDTTNAVAFEEQDTLITVPGIILKYTGGSGTLSVGDTLGNSVNSATYTVKEIIEGDSTAGTIICSSSTIGTTDVAQTLDNDPGGWTATYTVGSIKFFHWFINADGLTAQELYDYLNAKLDEGTLDTATPIFMDEMLNWAVGDTNALPLVGDTLGSPNKFKTVRNRTDTSGVAIYNLGGSGLAQISAYTSDDGTEFIPAATVTLTVTVVEAEDFVTAIVGARVGIHKQSDNSEIMNTTTNGSGIASISFSYTSDIPVFIRVRDEDENYVKIPATITSSGLDVTAAVADDNIYTAT